MVFDEMIHPPQVTINEELIATADETAEALARLRDSSLQKPLTALRAVCEEAKRAWSGSNLGYHASVYYEIVSRGVV
ncbi:MAG: hypothetical protein ABR929_15065 [Roseiarcus sp.]|jgi:hypothetical protein